MGEWTESLICWLWGSGLKYVISCLWGSELSLGTFIYGERNPSWISWVLGTELSLRLVWGSGLSLGISGYGGMDCIWGKLGMGE